MENLEGKKSRRTFAHVFHGIRFKVNKEDCGCRETTFLFLYTPEKKGRKTILKRKKR